MTDKCSGHVKVCEWKDIVGVLGISTRAKRTDVCVSLLEYEHMF